jgi:hemerythrin
MERMLSSSWLRQIRPAVKAGSMLLLWTNNLSVDVQELDEGTKKLIRIINELHAAIRDAKANGAVDKQEIEIALHRLENYVLHYCPREERLLASIEYEGLNEQIEDHRRLRASIAEMSVRFKNSTRPRDAEELMHFIFDWVTNHIYLADKRFIKALREHPEVLR